MLGNAVGGEVVGMESRSVLHFCFKPSPECRFL